MKTIIYFLLFLMFCANSILLSTTYYVDNSRPDDTGEGTSWATAKKTIQAAINVASSGDVILVKYNSSGSTTYSITASLTINGKDLKLTSDDGDGTGWDIWHASI